MAATNQALLARQPGSSVATAFPQVNTAQNLDLIQIVNEGGSVLLNVDYTGAVHNPASGATNGVRIGQYLTRLTSGTTAALFADAFTNQDQEDILQVQAVGGSIAYYLDYLGVAH